MPNMNPSGEIYTTILNFERATKTYLGKFTWSEDEDTETRDLIKKLNCFVSSPQFQTLKNELSVNETDEIDVKEAERIKKNYANRLMDLWSDNQMTMDDMNQLRKLVKYHNMFTKNTFENFITFIELNASELEKEPKDASEQPKEQPKEQQEENKQENNNNEKPEEKQEEHQEEHQENIEEKVNKNIDEEKVNEDIDEEEDIIEEDNIAPTLDQREEDRKTARNNPKPADFDKHRINRVRFINNYWSTKEFAMSSTDFDDFDDILSDCLEESSPYANTVRGRLIKAKELLESIEKRQLQLKELNEMAKRYEQLGDDPLHACVEDHAKMYRHLLASKNAMEKIKQSDGIKAVIESIKDQMDSLMPKNKEFTDNNEKIYSAQQEFKNTIADQIADEQFEKFHRAQPKGNKSAKDIQKNCAAKILAVNILKNLDPQHEQSPADLFSAKNIKDVANAIKQTEWFKHQNIISLKNDVVDPGVIDGKVMEAVNNSLSKLENNLQGKAVPQTGIIQDIINKHQQKDLLKK